MKDDTRSPPIEETARTRSPWRAQLSLRFARRADATLLVERRHEGPLVVQKSLHPEGPDVCQAVVVHPPGGIAGGDLLAIDVEVGERAHAQLVTPGAAKWYRSGGPAANQEVRLRARAGAFLEWLPHESIVFDGARARTSIRVELEDDALAIVWDVVSLGRVAAGERFARGELAQRVEVVRDGALLWVERGLITGASTMLSALPGLAGRAAFGTMLFCAPAIDPRWLAIAREVGSDIASGDCAVTHVPGVMIARCRSASAQAAHEWFRDLWAALRAHVIGRDAVRPRLWQT